MLSIEESVVLLGAWTSMYIYQGAKLIWESKGEKMQKGVEEFVEAEQRRKTCGVCWWVAGVWSCLIGNRMLGKIEANCDMD
ncbi:hypothetical protein Hanom_Chr12g01143171 [Helianthus anomalus]